MRKRTDLQELLPESHRDLVEVFCPNWTLSFNDVLKISSQRKENLLGGG
jgi:hypothetical protein